MSIQLFHFQELLSIKRSPASRSCSCNGLTVQRILHITGSEDTFDISLEVVNDTSKGSLVGTFEEEYEVGEEVSFTVTSVGENTVKEVRFNGRVVTAENGTYTVTIVATDNVLEVVYNVPEAGGCNSSLSSMMSCVIAVCGLAVVLKKREN